MRSIPPSSHRITCTNTARTAIVGACTGGCTVTVTGFGTVSATNLAFYALVLVQ